MERAHGPEDPGPRGTGGRRSPWLYTGLGCAGLLAVGLVLTLLTFLALDRREDGDARTAGEVPGPGDTVSHEGMYFRVARTEVLSRIDGLVPGGEFLVVHLDVAGTGPDQQFWRDEQHVYTHAGVPVEEDPEATGRLGGPMWVTLPANGRAVRTTVAFDVPSAEEISHIGLSARRRGGGETVVPLTH
ncbi:hypothetical protein ACOALZ_08525 [Nocardiopsis algeriensis]|uniref:hypothetical protein n=1 Tax=Nocardiopsis algeriensis TaxID=1478215 RepID=UPI003B42BE1D